MEIGCRIDVHDPSADLHEEAEDAERVVAPVVDRLTYDYLAMAMRSERRGLEGGPVAPITTFQATTDEQGSDGRRKRLAGALLVVRERR